MSRLALTDRAVLAIGGADATNFLQGLVTADTGRLAPGGACAAALLTPQGKVLFDMLIARRADGYLIDCRADMAESLARRLGFYRLRADVTIAPRDDLVVAWQPAASAAATGATADPRLERLGLREWTEKSSGLEDGTADYHAARIAAGVAEAGADYDPDTVFPHEANLDLLTGVAFDKGCFIGQEVVSRMQHRGTARKRFIPCDVEGEVPARGSEVTAAGRAIGTVGSASGARVLALLRLDRLEAAEHAGDAVTAGNARLVASRPDWLTARLPAAASA